MHFGQLFFARDSNLLPIPYDFGTKTKHTQLQLLSGLAQALHYVCKHCRYLVYSPLIAYMHVYRFSGAHRHHVQPFPVSRRQIMLSALDS